MLSSLLDIICQSISICYFNFDNHYDIVLLSMIVFVHHSIFNLSVLLTLIDVTSSNTLNIFLY